MSVEHEIELVVNGQQQQQIVGYGATIQEIFVKAKVDGYIDIKETRKFILEVTLLVKKMKYMISNILSTDNMDEQGYISIGTVYVLGPVKEEDVSFTIKLTYITVSTVT